VNLSGVDDPDDPDHPTRRLPTDAERRKHLRSWPRGIPVVAAPDLPEADDGDDTASPYDEPLVATRRDWDAIHRSDRDPSAPVMPMELSAVIRRLERRLLKQHRELGTTVQLLGGTVGQLGETVAAHAQVVGPARQAASWALRGTVVAVLAAAAFLYHRGGDEQHVTDEIQTLRRQVDRLESQLDQLRTQNQLKERQ